jgi:hypothetical protein
VEGRSRACAHHRATRTAAPITTKTRPPGRQSGRTMFRGHRAGGSRSRGGVALWPVWREQTALQEQEADEAATAREPPSLYEPAKPVTASLPCPALCCGHDCPSFRRSPSCLCCASAVTLVLPILTRIPPLRHAQRRQGPP